VGILSMGGFLLVHGWHRSAQRQRTQMQPMVTPIADAKTPHARQPELAAPRSATSQAASAAAAGEQQRDKR